jgi:hypothetical protein
VLNDEDVQRVAEAVAGSAQGDLVPISHFVSLGSHEYTFHSDTEASEPLPGQQIWTAVSRELDARWGVIVTQTCDLIRDPKDEPWIQLAPLLDLGEDEWERARTGKSLNTFALPQIPETGIAHAGVHGQISFPIEKAALLHPDLRPVTTPLDSNERLRLSAWLARRWGRHAFPDTTEDLVLGPLRSEITRRWDKPTTQPGAFVRSLLGVWATAYESAVIEVAFIMDGNKLALHQNALRDAAALDAQAASLINACEKAIGRSGHQLAVDASVYTLDEISAEDLLLPMRQVDMDLLPLNGYLADAAAETVGAAGDDV